MIDLVVFLVTSFVLAILGLVVFLRNTSDTVSRLFGMLTVVATLWGLANYLTNHVSGHSVQLFTNRLSLFIGFLLIQSVWLLSLYFPKKLGVHTIQRKVSVVATSVLLFLTMFTSSIVSNVVYQPDKRITDIKTGSLFGVYVVAAAIFFGFLVYNFYRSFKSKELSRLERQQLVYASTGLLLSFLWAIMTAAVVPSLTNNWELSKFGTAGTLFMVTLTSFAIIKHKLFDIRLVIARSLGYILSLGTIGASAAILLFIVSSWLQAWGVAPAVLRGFYIFIAVSLALTYQPMKRFFDRVTNRLFYRDAYDPQKFLDEFNRVLVSAYELRPLLKSGSDVIATHLKPDFSLFVIRSTTGAQFRQIGTKIHPEIDQDEVDVLTKSLNQRHARIIVSDELDDKDELRSLMRQKGIAIVANLAPHSRDSLGYLLIGHKKSGNIYSSQDIGIIEILTNELIIAVQNALRFEEIERFNATLQQRINEATAKLRRTNTKLKEMDETKDDFISMASHQLRTPLTSIKGYISMVLEEDAGKVTHMQREMLGQAFFSSQRMVYLIADLLNVSRLRTGKFVIEASPVNLAHVVSEEIEQLTQVAKARSQTLTYILPKDFPDLMLDEVKTRQVIMNLIDNALHYTPSGGKIDVELKETNTTVEMRVTDNGIGVPKGEQHHLFTKFYRAGNARRTRPDGTGLGLFMAKKVVASQDGAIIFESQENKGSTFGFIFSKAGHAVTDVPKQPVSVKN